MKLTSDLFLGNKQIKEVGFPTDHHDVITRAYLDTKIASWNGYRYYSVDPSGDDNNLGYSDISASEASKCSIRSVEKLTSIIPRIGSGASICIAIAGGRYGDFKLSLIDYDYVDIINNSNPIVLGKYYISNTISAFRLALANINGSHAVLNNIDLNFCRVRFDKDTITSTLRNFESDLNFVEYQFVGLKTPIPFSIYPSGEDIIFLEAPSVVMKSFQLNVWTFNQIRIEGIGATDKFICNSPLNKPDISFCYGPDIINT